LPKNSHKYFGNAFGLKPYTYSRRHVTYGFIGLGQMGARMAKNLMSKSKEPLYVYDKVPEACKEIKSLGAKVESSPRGVAEQSDVIITMLRADDQVLSCYTDEKDGIIKAIRKNALLIDSSTVSYLTTRKLAEIFGKAHPSVHIVDAPVSGGIGAAEAGTLTFMCGGSKQSFELAEKVLKCMGAKIFHCGAQPGSGQIVKICNNLILAISMDAVSEGMNLGVKLGVDANKLAEIVNTSSGRCWSSDTYNPCPGVMPKVPASNQYKGGFAVDLMRKDLQLALQAANSVNASTPLAGSVKQLYDMVSSRGYGDKDFSFLYQFVKGAENDDSYGA